MKAQLGMDVIIAIIIFIVFVSYLFFQLLILRPRYLQQIKAERIRAETYQISELLINDPGEPIDWTIDNVKRIGLSDENSNLTNLISWSKVQKLNSICSDYESVRKKIGVENYQFMINIIDRDSGESIACLPPPGAIHASIINFTVKRIVGINTSTSIHSGEVSVRVW